MKFKTTQKAIKENYTTVIYTGYCNLQHLLACESPVAYTARREGWAADVYEIDNSTALVTGYAPFGTIRADITLVYRYESYAADVLSNRKSYPDPAQVLRDLMKKFAEEVKNNGKH